MGQFIKAKVYKILKNTSFQAMAFCAFETFCYTPGLGPRVKQLLFNLVNYIYICTVDKNK